MKCLVTGGAGFLGSHLTEKLLAEGRQVRVLDNLRAGTLENISEEADFIKGGICSQHKAIHAVKDIDVVWHLAAIPSAPLCRERPVKSTRVNVDGTVQIITEAIHEGVDRIVFASSAAARHSKTVYGVQKRASERLSQEVICGSPVEYAALRFENLYGPGAHSGVIRAFVEAAMNDRPLEIHGDGQQSRDFLYVEDAAEAAALAGTCGVPPCNPHYSVGTGTNTSIEAVAEHIENVCGPVERSHTEARSRDIRRSRGEPIAFRDWTGWCPETQLPDGLLKTEEAMKNGR